MAPQTLGDIARFTLHVAKALRLAERPGEFIARAEIEAEADRWVNRRSRPRRTGTADGWRCCSRAMSFDG